MSALGSIWKGLRYVFDDDYRQEQFRKKDRESQEKISGLYSQRRDDEMERLREGARLGRENTHDELSLRNQNEIGILDRRHKFDLEDVGARGNEERQTFKSNYDYQAPDRRREVAMHLFPDLGLLNPTRENVRAISPELADTLPEQFTNENIATNRRNSMQSGHGKTEADRETDLAWDLGKKGAIDRMEHDREYYDPERAIEEIALNRKRTMVGDNAPMFGGDKESVYNYAVTQALERLKGWDPQQHSDRPYAMSPAAYHALMSNAGTDVPEVMDEKTHRITQHGSHPAAVVASALLQLAEQGHIDLGKLADAAKIAARGGMGGHVTDETIRTMMQQLHSLQAQDKQP